MNTVRGDLYQLFFGLALVVTLILLMFPASLHANHFRYGTMSWEPVDDNGTVRLKMQNGWTSNHSDWNSFNTGNFKKNYVSIDWGDGNNSGATIDFKVLSRDNTTNDTITEMGDNSSSSWTVGVTHKYSSTGTYVVSWGSTARESVTNSANGTAWRNQTSVTPYFSASNSSNNSPVSAVPPRVQVQDNTIFNYQLVATDVNNDSLNYRWGQLNEFFVANGSGSSATYTMPTGMTLSSTGLINWDVRDSVLSASEGSLWVAVVMIEDYYDNSSVKSYIPVDFFFRISSASNDPPAMIGIPTTTQTISIGNTKTFTFTATDDSGLAPTFSILNPPSDNSSIWSTSTSTSGDTSTFSISFTPISSMDNATYAVNIRSTDGDGMTKDQTIGLKVTSIMNTDPTAPTLVSPSNGDTIANPVTFRWKNSTDADNDAISYSLYFCTDSGFAGCSGTSVVAGGKLIPPFNQNLPDYSISWPRYLHAATIYNQISQDRSMIPKWMIMLTAFGLLSSLISFSLKNIYHRKLTFILILLILFFSLSTNSCSRSDSSISESNSSSSDDSNASSTSDGASITINDMTYTSSDLKGKSTRYYWKVIAADTKGGSAESATWSFTVQ